MTGPASDPPQERRRFSRVQVLEATAATVFAAAILGTAAGVGWLVIALPNELSQLKLQIKQVVANQDSFGQRFVELEKQVVDHDRRIIRLELK